MAGFQTISPPSESHDVKRRISLPASPTPRQLRIASDLMRRAPLTWSRPKVEPDPMPYVSSWLSFSDVLGKAMPPRELVECIRLFNWRDTYAKLAYLAALLANGTDGLFGSAVRARTTDLLVAQRGHINPDIASIAERLNREPGRRPIAHEGVIYFLEALAILEGTEEGPCIDDATLALMMMAANDHVGQWSLESGTPKLEDLVNDLIKLTRFNRTDSIMRSFVRAFLMLNKPPSKGRFARPDEWAKLQEAAFGQPFDKFFETFIVPIVLWSRRWGVGPASDHLAFPSIHRTVWLMHTNVDTEFGEGFLRSLSATRAELKTAFEKNRRPDGLPRTVSPFYRTPFVDVGNETLVAASPHVVLEQLRMGLWGRFRAGAQRLDPKQGTEDWLRAFGYAFEDWCRHIATVAQESPTFRGSIKMSRAPGDADEIEDVVLRHGEDIILFSVKARVLPEAVAKDDQDGGQALQWLNDFFFGDRDRSKSQRPGALVLLNTKVDNIRNGLYEPDLPRKVRVFPVLVTFEDLGENQLL